MSQLQPAITRNLYEYADYMKKSLILAIVLMLGSVVTLLTIYFTEALGFILLIGLAIIIAALALLVFQIIMLVRLSRASTASRDPLLSRSFQLFIATIILGVIDIFSSFILAVDLSTWINLLSSILTIFAYKAIVDYTAQNYTDVGDIKGGFQMYMISAVISIGLGLISAVIFVISPIGSSIVIILIGVIVSIVSIVGQFKMANGMLRIYSGGAQFQSPTQFGPSSQFSSSSQFGGPSSSTFTQQPSNEPTFQSYGASSPPSATYRPTSGPTSGFNSSSTTMTKICAMCGAPLPEGTRFCGTCGAKQ